MYKERECRELIEELKSTQMLEQEDHEETHMINLQQENDQLMQENHLYQILDSLEGKTIHGSLDFLSKVSFIIIYQDNSLNYLSCHLQELVRLEGERKIHAFALLVEREKYMRNATEASKQQVERNRRREFDEMFKQIVKVNQDSVETYLEDIVREENDWISDKTTKECILEVCDKVDSISKHASEK